MNNPKSICFIGHSMVYNYQLVREKLKEIIIECINEGFLIYYVGTHGDFDELAYNVCKELEKIYPIEVIKVLSSLTALQGKKNEFSINNKTIMFSIEQEYFKNRITSSNKQMIDFSNRVISYVEQYRYSTGAKKSFKYALKHNKEIINIVTNLEDKKIYSEFYNIK